MKKNITILVSSLLVLFASCKPEVDGNLPDGQFYLLGIDGKEIVDATFYDAQMEGEFKVNAYLGGFHGIEGQVSLIADDNVLLKYNETHGSSYMFLPEEFYDIPADAVKVSADSRSVSFVCKVDCEGLRNLDDLDEYLLPLSLVSDNLPLNPSKKSICYRFSVKDLTISMNNPGIEDVHITTGLDPVHSVPVSVVTEGDKCTVDYDYKFYFLDGSAQGNDANLLNDLLGYGRLAPNDSYAVTTENKVKEGTNESISTLNFKVDKLPYGVSYIAVALDDDDLVAENILTKAKVYRIFKDAELLPRDGWFVPYSNTFAGIAGNTTKYGTHLLIDGDLSSLWQAPWKAANDSYDPYFEGWTYIANTDKSLGRLPMLCIVDMGKTKIVSGVKVSRRISSERHWNLTKTGEVWASNDATGNDVLADCFGKSLDRVDGITEAQSKAWNGKKFVKVAEFDFGAVNNNMDQEMTIYFDAVEARFMKIVLTEDPVDQVILALSEFNVIGKK